MAYQRCRGLLVREIFNGLSAEADLMPLATRCINCGDIEGSADRTNRIYYPAVKRSALAGWPGRQASCSNDLILNGMLL